MFNITGDWNEILAPEFEKDYFKKLWQQVEAEYERGPVYPAKENIFNALRYTPIRTTAGDRHTVLPFRYSRALPCRRL